MLFRILLIHYLTLTWLFDGISSFGTIIGEHTERFEFVLYLYSAGTEGIYDENS